MNAATEAKFKPFESPATRDFSDAKVNAPDAAKAVDGGAPDKASFRDILLNSNDDTARERVAQKNGDQLRMAKSDDEFAKMMAAKANQGVTRKPQNELDKDAFLKLFVTQMRNQDPMSPDNSSQMAAQLAQFHGLEQMMNVNKNLEKMQNDEALGRAVTLLNFVGKDIKLDNGKLMVEGGKVATDASFKLDNESVKTILEVRDGAGVVVASKDLGHVAPGETKLEWSGGNKNGKPLSDGAYTFSIQATDMQGQTLAAPVSSTLQVTGVDLHDGGGSFYTAVGKVGVREVASVGSQGYSKVRPASAENLVPPLAGDAAAEGSPALANAGAVAAQQNAQPPEPKRAGAAATGLNNGSSGEQTAARLPISVPGPVPAAQVPAVKVEKPSPVPVKSDKLASAKAQKA
jgi:flagellar hook assembly protein FlgD